ncbi:MAG: hypothetical protein N2V78_08205 [Methanophagales archaeon]|nr:hypothetical protein [Methanophagales archaeon]MCW3140991.1 hypothetical protein [Methanophagales archaeon]
MDNYRLKSDYESAEPETRYKEFVQGWGRIYNYESRIIVCLSKKRSTGCLINAPFFGWLGGWRKICLLVRESIGVRLDVKALR